MNLNLIVKGMRPKTLIAALVPPVSAYSFYFTEVRAHDEIWVLILCVFLALFIQIATNFYNDAIDFIKGADENRSGPERITTQDQISPKMVFAIGHVFILLAFICGIPLVLKGGVVILILGLISLFFAYGYTGGPFPLAYLGLGELFVFIFFGIVATCGSFYLYSLELNLSIFVLGTQIGLLSSVLIAINNYRDKETDVLVGKKTLATKMTNSNFLLLIDIFLFVPYLLVLYFVFTHDLKYMFNIFSVPLAHKIRAELKEVTKNEDFNLYLAMSGKHLFVFAFLFCCISLWV
ncbi:MAG: 1,4-dihydroxy-2-naphthoate octaprenyltransferase [Bacteriovoracaceae bacterium]|jgi:1,4-dihydroxy-2-naphthoate octaprenyltransferase